MSAPKSEPPRLPTFLLREDREDAMHYYQFNIGDYIKHTTHLSAEEDLCYRRLLDLYYDTEQAIPTDIQWVSRRIRMGSPVVDSVLKEFFKETPEGYTNPRADAEIADYHAYIDKQRSNGKLGGRPKKTGGKPIANPSETQVEPKKSLNTNQQTLTKNHKRETPAVSCPAGVDAQVWSDWLSIRKAKRLPLTETAWEQLQGEARKAGLSMDVVIRECCLLGWGAFKASWWEREGKTNQGERNSSVLSGLTRGMVGGGNVKLLAN